VTASPSPAAVPVLLVHGYGGGTYELATLAARVRASGRAVTLVALPDAGTADLARSVAALDTAARRTGGARVDVAGFSLGGIVARAWAAGPGRTRARLVVQLASPNQGVVLAGATCDGRHACGQLRPGSAYLASIPAVPAEVAVVSVWSTYDRLVGPASASLPGALGVELQRICRDDRSGHLALRTDPAAVGAVVAALAGRSPLRLRCAELRRLGG
jgi:pimeloyl-ACP methyl ester carboxylesterase